MLADFLTAKTFLVEVGRFSDSQYFFISRQQIF